MADVDNIDLSMFRLVLIIEVVCSLSANLWVILYFFHNCVI